MERKAREEERANSMTRDEFWQQNRKQLTKAQREQLEQRTDDILLLAAAMDDYVSGTDQTSQQDLLDTIEEVREEVEKNGVCNLHTVLVEFWKPWEKNFFEAVVAQAGATETFVKYGYITAIPGHKLHAWEQKFPAYRRPPRHGQVAIIQRPVKAGTRKVLFSRLL